MPEQAHKSAMKEVKRLKKMPSHMPEHAMIRSAFFFFCGLQFSFLVQSLVIKYASISVSHRALIVVKCRGILHIDA